MRLKGAYTGSIVSFFAASVLLTSIASFSLSLFTYLKGKEKELNRSLALFSLALAVWTLAQWLGVAIEGEKTALFFMRTQVGAAVFLPVFFLKFIFSLLRIEGKKRALLLVQYIIAAAFIALDFTPWFVGELNVIWGFKYYPQLTRVYAAFAFWLISSFLFGLGQLVAAMRQAEGEQYKKYLYVFAASLIGFLGGGTSFCPIFGINLPVVSHFALPLYVGVAVYAIAKHKLLDITVYVRKGLVYSFITACFTALYVLLLYLSQNYLRVFAGYGSVIVSVFTVFGICLVFQPLRDWSQTIIDNWFFKSHYDYQETMKRFSQRLSAVFRIEELDAVVKDKLRETLKIRDVQICLGEGAPLFNPVFSIEVESRGRKWGNLFLGQKLSGDGYSLEDKNLLATLANQIAATFENIQLYQKLARSENLAMLGTLAAGMAHEIRNPLASIKGMTQVLPENLDDADFIEKYIEIVLRQLDRINGIVEKLLQAGKKPKLDKREIDINRIIRETLELNSSLCRKQKIDVVARLEKLPPVLADPSQLRLVFENLILNAIDAMPGGGRLLIKSRIEKKEFSKKCVVQIEDAGEGISSDALAKIFDPFFTLKEKGTGLGLFMALRVTQEHGGSIDVKSPAPGSTRGALFTLWMPV